jgi:hypothetical protein
MTKLRHLLLFAAALPMAAATAAETAASQPSVNRAVPASALTDIERSNYREIFAAIRASDWTGAAARLDGMGDGPLHALARAELYLAKDRHEWSWSLCWHCWRERPNCPTPPSSRSLHRHAVQSNFPTCPLRKSLSGKAASPGARARATSRATRWRRSSNS